jgi:hypothetical protein
MYQHQHAPLPVEQLKGVPQPLVVLLESLLEKARAFETALQRRDQRRNQRQGFIDGVAAIEKHRQKVLELHNTVGPAPEETKVSLIKLHFELRDLQNALQERKQRQDPNWMYDDDDVVDEPEILRDLEEVLRQLGDEEKAARLRDYGRVHLDLLKVKDRDGDNNLVHLLIKMDKDFTWEYVCNGERFNIFMKCFLQPVSNGGGYVTKLHYPVYHSPWSGNGHWPEEEFKALLERPLSESFPSDAIQRSVGEAKLPEPVATVRPVVEEVNPFVALYRGLSAKNKFVVILGLPALISGILMNLLHSPLVSILAVCYCRLCPDRVTRG